ncbi:2-polyprenyl-3-methyl-5-hydroxy-6-metoxy-1,4-benzoquinol methylase [Syntrophus gentianae]|uniref:2-polyprenyl-3-methyl-5-hydroxy-6-metoxy-1,4-benzoquinol methylase n=1 Tax=Syntrophus gentianae TaxID=43775 RepID=A0A1H7ZBD2_9BACT|nr:class I SAM-dependent methyltransferase [Syntrophus gentianae]SEM54868.1 2-polyprenyl-3-methyl-5-hydroxy-6-metoxy-1,4-benzoquinol methylase [Syntrophus gentianae]
MAEGKNCRACGNVLGNESLLCLSGMPGAVQNLPVDRQEAMASGVALDVRQCDFCGLVQLTNRPVPYYRDVIRAGSFSPSMRARQLNEFQRFVERFSLQGKNILEIGSGRGEYLSLLKELPVRAFGMEHNAQYIQTANEKGLKTFPGYPTDLTGPLTDLVFDAFVSINFLEHAPEPGAFLRSCANLVSETAIGMIAVPDLEFELRDNYLFSFMSDHLSYFSSDSLRNTLILNGFEVIDLFRNDKLNVVTAYFQRRRPCDLSAPMGRYDNVTGKINDYLDSILDSGGRVAVWGASHLAFSILSAAGMQNRISYIVDSATFKQGRFAPPSGLEIFSPSHLFEDPVNAVLIFCPEYSAEIVGEVKEKYHPIVQHIATFKNGGLEIVSE